MKAIVNTEYGPPEVLKLEEVEKQQPKDKEILIRVHATTVTFGEIAARNFPKIMSPRKFTMPLILWLPTRIMFGIRKPKNKILGAEFSGEIEAVGKESKQFKVGDQVFGYRGPSFGANAEYLCMPEDGIVSIKPINMTYEEAAGVPYGAITALTLLRKVDIKPGQKILINGASGSIGSYAVQFVKHYGAEVTGVCRTSKLEYVKSLGADHVIDYTQEDFTKNGETYSVIFDILRKTSFSKCKKSLTNDGIHLLASFKFREIFQMIRTKIVGSKKVICALSFEDQKDLVYIKELIEDGKINSIIDKIYPLEQIVEAHQYVENGHKKGTVVITFDQI